MPKRQRDIPHHSELVEYDHAVAGHAGTLSDESGNLFFKPVHQQEIDFYQSAVEDHPGFADVMPRFYGTLTRGGTTEASSEGSSPTESSATPESQAPTPTQDKPKEEWAPNKNRKLDTCQYLALDNASKGYTHVNILDVKLGVRLWADDAPQAKKDRFDQIVKVTTHKNFAFRIAGMRVYHADASTPQLKEGRKPEFERDGDYNVYDKDFGRYYVNDDNLMDSFRSFVFNKASGVDEALGKAVCSAFVRDLEKIQEALEKEESRMYSASCLFLFEGDGNVLRRSIEAHNQKATEIERAAAAPKKADSSVPRQDSGVCLEDDETTEVAVMETIVEGGTVEAGATADDDDLDSDDGEPEHRTCGVKLIDFAHAQWTPGQGPDENSLQGVRNLVRMFKELAA